MRRKNKTRESFNKWVKDQELEQDPRDHLNYPGDCQDVIGQVVGPDRFGAYYEAVDAVYEMATNSTRVAFRPVYRPGVGGRVRVQ
ncbi:hypothetical protein SEA_ARCHIMEDES_54 [Gordonia phage Archimedes]|uniref:Uncharacterized protein n=1 Tax=Gordonia phage Archimedes TaxID=2759389 RepID=A0A7L7SP78_9CAUD|nr:hypothetical protein KCH38_gp54 [Gordonia phage Archimedes]QOC55754.1 hypothetical protein SEA_ARCHIMEDES_54 [Gordonia phage Archimedes]